MLGEDFVALEWRLPEDAVRETPHKAAKLNSALVSVTSVSNLLVILFCATPNDYTGMISMSLSERLEETLIAYKQRLPAIIGAMNQA